MSDPSFFPRKQSYKFSFDTCFWAVSWSLRLWYNQPQRWQLIIYNRYQNLKLETDGLSSFRIFLVTLFPQYCTPEPNNGRDCRVRESGQVWGVTQTGHWRLQLGLKRFLFRFLPVFSLLEEGCHPTSFHLYSSVSHRWGYRNHLQSVKRFNGRYWRLPLSNGTSFPPSNKTKPQKKKDFPVFYTVFLRR